MKRKKESLTSIKEIIRNLFNNPSSPLSMDKKELCDAWEEIAGDMLKEQCTPEWLRKGILGIRVSTPIMLQEMRFREKLLRKKLNERIGREAIKKIEFYLYFSS